MSKAIGGYVRRSERRYVPPAPDDGIPRCGYCRARLDLGMWPHLCKELTFGTTLPPVLPVQPFEVTEAAGGFLARMLSAPDPKPGSPYVHTFTLPEPEYDGEGNEIWRPLDPTHTLTGEGVRFEIGAVVPPGERIEITADFCQCPACREARCEP